MPGENFALIYRTGHGIVCALKADAPENANEVQFVGKAGFTAALRPNM